MTPPTALHQHQALLATRLWCWCRVSGVARNISCKPGATGDLESKGELYIAVDNSNRGRAAQLEETSEFLAGFEAFSEGERETRHTGVASRSGRKGCWFSSRRRRATPCSRFVHASESVGYDI